MKIKEFDTYKAVYCGLCKQLGKVYGPIARMTLSYDFAFLATVSLGVKEENGTFRMERCVYNPLKKKACLCSCDDLSLSASAAMILLYYKLKDNFDDGNFGDKCLSLLGMLLARPAKKKAERLYPELGKLAADYIQQQHQVEQSDSVSVDRAAEPTASMLAGVFSLLSEKESQKTVLRRMGYLLGRYIYFMDALDDLEEDIEADNYNVFYQKFLSEQGDIGTVSISAIKEYATEVVNLTVGQIAAAYELVQLNRCKTILDNIIYLGLHTQLHLVLKRPQEKRRLNQI